MVTETKRFEDYQGFQSSVMERLKAIQSDGEAQFCFKAWGSGTDEYQDGDYDDITHRVSSCLQPPNEENKEKRTRCMMQVINMDTGQGLQADWIPWHSAKRLQGTVSNTVFPRHTHPID